ncbi:hemerythrin/HHE cation-binding motif [Macleaya cordata]|uniref:Hemerythrin/HHE cation-binding motif n=1 Tax=Macleaya cordata TaxID=56857 RepID=A0A200QHU7_MACCD|nr:hemerythrin/HHE cation-binding motif [Macleaya cordata]
MGNCFPKQKKSSAEIAPSDFIKGSPVVRLYGSPSSNLTSFIRIALLYKSVSVNFIPSENPHFGSENPVLQLGSDTVTGSSETLLRYIEGKFPNPPLLDRIDSAGNQAVPGIVLAVTIQHKCMTWYLESLVKWAEDLATRGKGRAVDPSMGSPVMEVRKFGRSYSQLLEVMLEHAQMEERVLFPVFERADRGLSKAANEDHARDLPIMNGIKEDIKSIGVLDAGNPVYQEGLFNLSSRLKTLQEHCKEHFEEEERELLPLLEATELSKEQHDRMVEQCVEVMEGTHSHLIHFLILGLLPQDVIQYLNLIIRCTTNTERVGSMLRTLTSRIESTISSSNHRPSQSQHHLAKYRGTTVPSNEYCQMG